MIRLYRALLLAYPPAFRRAYGDLMLQLFRDRYRAAAHSHRAMAKVIYQTALDYIVSVPRERIDEMKLRANTILGLALLVTPTAFLTAVILEFYMGVSAGPLHGLYESAGRPAVDALIILGPPLALLVISAPMLMRVWTHIREEGFATGPVIAQVIQRENTMALILLGVTVTLGLIFTTYFFVENWPCLIGQALAC